jgi:anti-repressor protein
MSLLTLIGWEAFLLSVNDLQQYTNGKFNLPVRQLPDGSIEFDAEHAAIGLGICRTADSGNTVVRWDRVRKYLSCPQVGMGDFTVNHFLSIR